MSRSDALQGSYRGGDDIPVARPFALSHLLWQVLHDEATYPTGVELWDIAVTIPRIGSDGDEEGI